MPRPTCSIIIPSRNCLNYLPTALGSIDLQHRSDLEVVVIDDGSNDGTAEWVRARAKTSFELTLLETGGIGPGDARNAGIEVARGDLIAFLDADDVWWPGKLDRQLAYHAAHPDVGLSFHDYLHVTPDMRSLGTCFEFWDCAWTKVASADYFTVADAQAKLLATNPVGTSTTIVRRDLLRRVGSFTPGRTGPEDWDLWLRLAAVAPVGCSTSIGTTYLVRPGSVTSSSSERLAGIRKIVDRYRQCPEPAMQQAVAQAQARIFIAQAEIARGTGDRAGAATAHLKALLYAPSLRTAKSLAADAASLLAPWRASAALR